MARKLVVVLLIAALAWPVAGCGRKASPLPPEGSEYPRKYPAE